MSNQHLSENEKRILLHIAREAIEKAIKGESYRHLLNQEFSDNLKDKGACFVTLTKHGELRGCIGTLEAYQSLVQDVCEHAVAAALQDFRFPPVKSSEMEHIKIEISRLTPTNSLIYNDAEDLKNKIRPNIDGVVLQDGIKKATFLPKVWEKLPDPEEFLSHLCVKMGSPADLWKRKKLVVNIYQVEEFAE